jgi:biotin-dependent carboxylase-like uncharacterized protein
MNDQATLTLLSAGMHTLVVDHGRPRSRSLGVPVGGAADSFSLAIGNALVGNPPQTAALELTLTGPTLQCDAPIACVLFGAPFEMILDDHLVTPGVTFTLNPNELLHIRGTPQRMRGYFCVRGGIDAPIVLGSRSSLQPLKSGERLACRSASIRGRSIDCDHEPDRPLRILPGRQTDWFPESALPGRSTWVVSQASNRMGLRLQGDPLPVPQAEMVSEPVCPGTVQVTRDGQCIILGVDGQTIGGYPKIAHVIRADLDRLGQMRPGDRVSFELVSLDRAEELYQQKVSLLREWLTRLEVAGEA